MKSAEVRQRFLDFFERHDHKIIASSSLIPSDASVLLTTAGMQQLVPYLRGDADAQKDFGTRRLTDAQKCFRTPDIEEVGDDTHHTFFEMLGSWSIGDYFKEEAIDLAWDLLTTEFAISPDKLSVTIFSGEQGIPRDKEAYELWLKKGVPALRIHEFGFSDNFWGPTATIGPCGPSTEIYYDWGVAYGCGQDNCGPNCEHNIGQRECQRFVEIWNLVFMEYMKNEKGEYEPLPQKNVDTGMGFERVVPILQGVKSSYETDLFTSLFDTIDSLCDPSLIVGLSKEEVARSKRIIADHVRGVCFLIGDGVSPAKSDRGYVLRRLLRRAFRHAKRLGIEADIDQALVPIVIDMYQDVYPDTFAADRQIVIRETIIAEKEKFFKTLERGLRQFDVAVTRLQSESQNEIDADTAFHLYDTFGFPIELVRELAGERGMIVDEVGFDVKFQAHQEVSRAGAQKKFAGVGEWGDQVASHHSATHLLHQAVRDVLGDHAQQAGSDMTPERLRFDVTHPEKITPDQLRAIEDKVNTQIKADLPVRVEEMSPDEAQRVGAIGLFRHKYGDTVTVWFIGDYSKEVCGGPHVEHTSQIKAFKIIKEESSGAGVRRIKAVVEDRAQALLDEKVT
jgi:alanyl-tRNA synthetase